MKIKDDSIYYYKRNNKYFKVYRHTSSNLTLIRDFVVMAGRTQSPYQWVELKWLKTEFEANRLVLIEDEPTIAKLLLRGAFNVA